MKLEWLNDPFDYFLMEEVFPEEMYKEMMDRLPPDSEYHQYNEKYKNRYLYDMEDKFWSQVVEYFENMHGGNIRVQMCRDFPGYTIGPHTDGKKEYSTELYYLTDKEYDCGTCIYVPKQHGFTSDGRSHLELSGFTRHSRAPYKPNSGMGFIRSDNSFHGVEPTDIVRNLIQVSIWA